MRPVQEDPAGANAPKNAQAGENRGASCQPLRQFRDRFERCETGGRGIRRSFDKAHEVATGLLGFVSLHGTGPETT